MGFTYSTSVSYVLFVFQGLFRRSVQNEKLRESIAQALGAVTNTFFRTKGQEDHKVSS